MSDSVAALFDIVFRGDILPGQNVVQVKQRLALLFKTDEAKINALFSGAATPLKRNLDKGTADKYAEVLRKVGADVQVTVAGKVTAKKAPKRQPQPTSLSEQPASIVKQKTLQDASSKFTLAPVGSDVLKPEERSHLEPVAVDTSQLSLRDSGAELLDASEKALVDAVQIDVSSLMLDEVGADLLSDNEKRHFEELTLDLAGIDLAPAGSDMGAIKKPAPPAPPDTSAIKLEN
jgi:hypothetical protein